MNELSNKEYMEQCAILDGKPDGLLEFYREKLNRTEKEKIEFLSQLENIKISQKEKHNMEWENYEFLNKINQLEKTLSETRILLMEERTNSLKLSNENKNLKEKLQKDNQKIYNLIGCLEPMEQKNIYEKVDIKSRYVKNDLNLENNLKKKNNKNVMIYDSKNNINKKELITKMGNDNIELNINKYDGNLLNSNKLIGMQKEIEVQKEQIKKLRDEINYINNQHYSSENILNNKLKEIIEKNQKLQRINNNLNGEYFKQKSVFSETEKKLNEEIDLLKKKILDLQSQKKLLKEQYDNDFKLSNNLFEKKNEEYINKINKKLLMKEESLNLLKHQYKSVQSLYNEKIKENKIIVEDLKKKLNNNNKKFSLKNQALETNTNHLKNQLSEKNEIINNLEEYIKSIDGTKKVKKTIKKK